MPYVGSYTWKIRQKVGHDRLLMPTVDTLAVRDDGKILMVFNKDFNGWTFPGGQCELDKGWADCALTELMEEAGVVAEKSDLVPFTATSGNGWAFTYANGDSIQCFSMAFEVKKWRIVSEALDDSEIAKRDFFSAEEIKKLQLSPSAGILLAAYEKYVETGEFQMTEVKS